MTHTPTEEQAAILDAVRSTDSNLLIDALAGAAKTTALEMISHAVSTPILAIAFNKKIADELQKRMSANTTAKTMHSLGYAAALRFLGIRRGTVNDKKKTEILRAKINALGLSQPQLEEVNENFGDLLRAVKFGAECGYIPNGPAQRNSIPLMDDDAFLAHFQGWDESWKLNDVEWDLIRNTSAKSILRAIEDHIFDFSDMVLIPGCFRVRFDHYPLIMVDEAQDLSALNHRILEKAAKNSRVIAVGDPCQAIYGFRGAHQDSMQLLSKQFSMRYLPLTTSFRCASDIVEHVHWRAPAMRSAAWAPKGEVEYKTEWTVNDIPNDDVAIICRNNAPLFSLAIKLIRAGRRPRLASGDVLGMIERELRGLGTATFTQEETLSAFEKYRDKQIKKYGERQFLLDRLDAMKDFITAADSLGLAISEVQRLMNSTGPIYLSTGHKAKGLEWDTVFFLDEKLVRREGQDPNLRYVIATRAKRRLVYVNSTELI